jgi:adenine-specific DNA methylase
MATNDKRLIEVAFPLKQASLDSVHEKTVRHGHISTIHLWPARRPLAASRAALIATLLSDPGTKEGRDRLLEKLGGRIVDVVKNKRLPSGRTEEKVVLETVGGVLHWGQECSPDIEWFRQKIKEDYGGRAPRVLDPFAGGGAIPLEAMRLGCDVTAVDINPVAWFILKCTLQYPQLLSGQHHPLPGFALQSPEFMEQFFKGTGKLTKKQLERNLKAVQDRLFPPAEVDLAWHVRAWGWWALQKAKVDLDKYYPAIDGKPTVAYLWARTVKCRNCRATVPLLKTKWLCKTDNKRVLLTMEPNEDKSSVVFGINTDVPVVGGNSAQRREHDKRLGAGTMSRSGVSCPCCNGAIMTMEEIRAEGLAGRLGFMPTAVALDGDGKEYRLPTPEELEIPAQAQADIESVFADLPFGIPDEPLPRKEALGFRVPLYGFDRWHKLFTSRQLLALGSLLRHIRDIPSALKEYGYTATWAEAVFMYVACGFDRLLDFANCGVQWKIDVPTINHSFVRFALPITWDFAEGNIIGDLAGGFQICYERICTALDSLDKWSFPGPEPTVLSGSATQMKLSGFDLIVTDPPYYDAIPYSDLMDFFYVWLRRCLAGLSKEFDATFSGSLNPKWDHTTGDGELIDDSSRFDGDRAKSRAAYEDGMFRAFRACHDSLLPNGRLVIVFANKQPDAWEALVSAIIRAGFVVDGSWPIQTEQATRMRAQASAALASSVWLVCKKRADLARPGWDNTVLTEMLERIQVKLREFWDAGIRGPDFVWAATGPALEVFSKHPVVKKANSAGEFMSVSEFLGHVRRIVVDFIVGQVLSHNGAAESVSGLDNITTYYVLHRYDFGFTEAPIGACILYAVSCGLTDRELTDRYEILARTGGSDSDDEVPEDEDAVEEESESSPTSSSKVKLRNWGQRHGKTLGLEIDGRPAPLIDQIHRLMGLWKLGDVVKVDEYLDARALRRNSIFIHLLQALIELSQAGSEERSILESLSNHVAARGVAYDDKQLPLSS